MNRFEPNAEGFTHFENDELRAVVPWSSLGDYRVTVPDAPDAPAPAPDAAAAAEAEAAAAAAAAAAATDSTS